MLHGFLDITSKESWLNTNLSNTVTEIVKGAVRIDNRFLTRKCHNGYCVYELFPVKEDEDEDKDKMSGLNFNLAYVRIEVKADCVSRLFKDSANTNISTEFRVIGFRSFDSFFEWALEPGLSR